MTFLIVILSVTILLCIGFLVSRIIEIGMIISNNLETKFYLNPLSNLKAFNKFLTNKGYEKLKLEHENSCVFLRKIARILIASILILVILILSNDILFES